MSEECCETKEDNLMNEDIAQDRAVTPIPQKIQFKEAFLERYKLLLGDKFDNYIKYSSSYIKKAIRVNTLKASVEKIKEELSPRWDLKPVPWCKEGFWITFKDGKRFDIGNLPQHQLGYIYVQDPASMIPPVVLDPKPGELVLDLCAAPGSKTSQLASYMENEGMLFANDVQGNRLKPLGLNMQRMGVTNCVITLNGNKKFAQGVFDKVLVDAPCSGTGTIRKSLKAALMWSPGLVKKMHYTQKYLIDLAYGLLKEGGTLVYSTCTQEPEENEAVVSFLLAKYPEADLLDINLDINSSNPILEFDGVKYDSRVKKCLRIYPQDNDTEGFFVAKITKKIL